MRSRDPANFEKTLPSLAKVSGENKLKTEDQDQDQTQDNNQKQDSSPHPGDTRMLPSDRVAPQGPSCQEGFHVQVVPIHL